MVDMGKANVLPETAWNKVLLAGIVLQIIVTNFLLTQSDAFSVMDASFSRVYGYFPSEAWSSKSGFPAATRLINVISIPIFFMSMIWGAKAKPAVARNKKTLAQALMLFLIATSGSIAICFFYTGNGFSFLEIGEHKSLFCLFSWVPHFMSGASLGISCALTKFIINRY